jgi:hypothetical protein
MTQDETRDGTTPPDAAQRIADFFRIRDDLNTISPGELLTADIREVLTELSGLRAENERHRIALADAMGAPHTKTADELIGWARDLYVEFGKVLTDRSKIGGDLAQARRDLEEVTVENERLEKLHDASVKVLAAHVDQVRAGKFRCGHPDHAQPGTGDAAQPDADVIEQAKEILRGTKFVASGVRANPWLYGGEAEIDRVVEPLASVGLLAARPCPTCATPAPSMSHNDGITDTAQPGEDPKPCGALEGSTGIECDLPKAHASHHEGTWHPGENDTEDSEESDFLDTVPAKELPPFLARRVRQEPDQGNGDTEGWQPLLGAWVTGTIMPDNQRAGEEMTGAWFGWGTDEHRVGWIDDEIGTISSIWPVRPDTLRPATEAKGQDPEVWAEAQRNAAELGAVYRAAKAAGGSDLDAIREIHRAVQDRGEVRPAIDEGTREDRDEH